MKRILLLIEHQQNRRMLSECLAEQYETLVFEEHLADVGAKLLSEAFDLCFVDVGAIELLRSEIVARRRLAIPSFLPFVFLTSLKSIGFTTGDLESLVDDIIYLPSQKQELRTRVRILLRSRSYSLQLKATQEELYHALSHEKELNELKSRFISTVSHEFRNPLNSISGMTQILQTYGEQLSPDKKKEVITQLQRNVKKTIALLDDVLTISRTDLGKLQFAPNSLNLVSFCRAIVNEVETSLNNKQPILLDYQIEQQDFHLDRKLLHHVLTNLLFNAGKYSPPGKVIDFIVTHSKSELIFKICDRGIGIPARDLPQIFDSFYRASNCGNFPGTGLGLAIAKQYIELHRGAIAVESELNVGTTFTVTIPDGRFKDTPDLEHSNILFKPD
jgi:signal transduction histidine kinase